MLTDLVRIHELGTSKAAENQEFRRYLAAHHHRPEAFQDIASRILQHTDCTACANCCRHSIVQVTDDDVQTIAAHLKTTAAATERLYTIADPEDAGGRILGASEDGCVFLEGNLCLIYEARPKACRDFPHVAHGTHSLGGRFSSICRWIPLCPIVYNAVEEYKHLVGFHSS